MYTPLRLFLMAAHTVLVFVMLVALVETVASETNSDLPRDVHELHQELSLW